MEKVHFDSNPSEETVEHALYVYLKITKTMNTLNKIHYNLLIQLFESFKSFYIKNFDIMPDVWKENLSKPLKKLNIYHVMKDLFPLLKWDDLIDDPFILLIQIANQIPIIINFDEFQELIKIDRENPKKIDKSLYYDMGVFLSSLLEYQILVVITGTQFTIINTIGENMGSPLNGKVGKFTLPNLKIEEQKEFVSYIIQDPVNSDEEKLYRLFENWLIRNSGGHPRSMYYMADEFLTQLELIGGLEKITDYTQFFKELDKKLFRLLEGEFWKSKYKNLIEGRIGIHDATELNQIFNYILTKLKINDFSLELGQLKSELYDTFANSDNEKQKRINNVLEILIQFGYLLINGYDNIYVTSRYALYSFLKDWSKYFSGWSAIFEECMNNPLIWEFILYSPQSFGWNFEVLIKYGLLGPIREMAVSKSFPFDFAENYGEFKTWQKEWVVSVPDKYEKIMEDYDLSKIHELSEKTYIMLPKTTGIDAIIKEDNKLIVIQITSGQKDYISQKFKKFKKFITEKVQNYSEKIIPWFITANNFNTTKKKTMDYDGLITNGDYLQSILDQYEGIN